MIDSIYVATSGLNGHQKGLKGVGNNVANMNTPGFKGSNNQFTDVFLRHSGNAQGQSLNGGGGLDMRPATINFQSGEIRSTSRDLDMALSGPGFFVAQSKQGEQLYTKSGRFEFNAEGRLVTMDSGHAVLGYVAEGSTDLTPISISALRNSKFAPTSVVKLSGNLSSTAGTTPAGPDHTTKPFTVYDSMGTPRTLTLALSVKRVTDPTTSEVSPVPGTWDVNVLEGSSTVGSGRFKMMGSSPDPTADRLDITLTALDQSTQTISLMLDVQTTGYSSGTTSSLEKLSVDGNAAGTLSQASVDSTGTVVITYTNGLTAKGPQLGVAEFPTPEVLSRASGANFTYSGQDPVRFVRLGKSTQLVSGSLELSNIDLTDQFSTMILIQRGFQASSQVLSTASEMIQSLYDLRSRR